MDSGDKEEYKPSAEYEQEFRDPLLDIKLTDSTELWLIQWPYKQEVNTFLASERLWDWFGNPDIHGKELSLELHGNGRLGGFEDSSGKMYDVLSFDSQEPDATVFLSSTSEPKIVGKISRRVSLVHYPEPKELEELNPKNMRQFYSTSSGNSMPNSSHRFSSPVQSSRRRNSQSTKSHSTYTHSSKQKSSLSEAGEPSKTPKRRRTHESNRSTDCSTLDSGGRHSGMTFSGSSERSHQGKSKKKLKAED
ncbi:hypothetical protein Pint_05407 [Pistacia integerrima]|uniref:Uncharacterized protein n=1 Tax=Pistacia integerrima TaxID=434235 RepID=A0ACC0Z499_9ROSI|nr:hypothetical protein Pint_05407 [Pistacia integerrima]